MKLLKIFLLIFPVLSLAQEIKDLPSVAYVYPAGAQRGQVSYVLIGGKNFENVKEFVGSAKSQNIEKIIVSGEGVKASLVESIIPADRSRAVGLINKLQKVLIERGLLEKREVNDKKAQQNIDFRAYPDLQKMRQEIIKEQRLFRLMKSTQAAFAETLELKIEVDAKAKLGKRTITVIGKNGISNSMPFFINDLPEYAEYSIRHKNLAVIKGATGNIASEVLEQDQAELKLKEKPLIQEVTPPLIINGQMDLLETDIYKFFAKKGQVFLVSVQARDLIPFIADAVPAWFQATISIKDSSGKEIAYQDDFFQSPDPILTFKIPQDGFYTLEIKDAIYRGREDFVYRITLGELPFITSIYPLAGYADKLNFVDINGVNLKSLNGEIFPHFGYNNLELAKANQRQAKIVFKADSLEKIQAEGNLSIEKAIQLKPFESVNSIIKNKGDTHFYKLSCAKSQRLLIEIFARRLNSPLDSLLSLFDKDLNLIASNDDCEDFSDALNTHHADSKIDFIAQENTYYISVKDTQNNAGAEYAYYLSISEPIPDFEIKASPANLNIVEGKSASFNISVIRKNGFDFPIEVKLKNAPKGLSLSGGYIPANCDNISMVLHCDNALKVGLYDIELEAITRYKGEEIKRELIPCEDMLQAFYYPHLVPANSHQVYVLPMEALHKYTVANMIKNKAQNAIADTLLIPYGKEARLFVGYYALPMKDKAFELEVELRDSGKGVFISKVENTPNGCFITLKSDPKISKKGQSENLIIDVFVAGSKEENELLQKARTGRNAQRLKVDTLKAILYKVF